MSTVHENTLTITCSAITAIDLVKDSIHITSGQPLESAGVTHDKSGAWKLTLNCGRSGSASVAQSYVSQAGGMYHMFVEPTFSGNSGTDSDEPEEMNFWFQATVFFGDHGVPLYFGQDGVDLINYWWIGGPMILNSSPYKSPMAYLVAPGGVLYKVAFVNENVDQLSFIPA